MSWIKRIAGTLAFLIWLIILIKWVPRVPYVYVFLSFVFLFSYLTWKSRNWKALWFNIAVFFTLCYIVEDYWGGWYIMGHLNPNVDRVDWGGDFYKQPKHKPDPILGTYPEKGKKYSLSRYSNGNPVYENITYSINSDGWRVCPHDLITYPPGPPYQNIAFLGCSFTFGQGMNDNQTMPWLVEEKSGGKYRSYDFAFIGYGAHQMLRILETHMIDSVIRDKKPVIGVYQGIMDHLVRSTGNYPFVTWNINGPHYQLNKDDIPEYVGGMEEMWNARIYANPLYEYIHKCILYQKTLEPRILGWTKTSRDMDLYINIVTRSRDLFEKQYGGKFYVIFWNDYQNPDCPLVISKLRHKGIYVITTSEIQYYYHDQPDIYLIYRDGHPNKLAHARMADYLLKKILEKPEPVKPAAKKK